LSLPHAALIAPSFSLALTLLETLAVKGLDNLLLPIVGRVVLNHLLWQSENALMLILLLEVLTIAALLPALVRPPVETYETKPSSSTPGTTARSSTRFRSDSS
jgi:hypothetical protein